MAITPKPAPKPKRMASYPSDGYRVAEELANGATIRMSENADADFLWQVVSSNTTTYFRTRNDARHFCQSLGWL